jgi:large subunit ribosomal protein L29
MKVNELRQKSESELKKLLQDNQEKLRLLRFNLASSKVKNIREIPMIKRNIARILTILKHKK